MSKLGITTPAAHVVNLDADGEPILKASVATTSPDAQVSFHGHQLRQFRKHSVEVTAAESVMLAVNSSQFITNHAATQDIEIDLKRDRYGVSPGVKVAGGFCDLFVKEPFEIKLCLPEGERFFLPDGTGSAFGDMLVLSGKGTAARIFADQYEWLVIVYQGSWHTETPVE